MSYKEVQRPGSPIHKAVNESLGPNCTLMKAVEKSPQGDLTKSIQHCQFGCLVRFWTAFSAVGKKEKGVPFDPPPPKAVLGDCGTLYRQKPFVTGNV